MIKNASDLNAKEIDSFMRTYKKYFSEFASRPTFELIEKLDNVVTKKNADQYAEESVTSVMSGNSIGVVSIAVGHVDSFITGKAIGETGVLAHLYLDKDLTPFEAHQRLLELYSQFAIELKNMGCTKVVTRTMNSATEFINSLESLDFQFSENMSESAFSLYGKQL